MEALLATDLYNVGDARLRALSAAELFELQALMRSIEAGDKLEPEANRR